MVEEKNSRVAALLAVVIACWAIFADKSQASFPGDPGLVAVQRSPDSRALASDIWLLDWQTGAASQVTDHGYSRSPAFSPDGRRIAFVTDVPRGKFNIWSVRPDGSGLRRLTKGSGELATESPAFSADGRWVAFSIESRAEENEIHRVAASGGHRITLVPGTGLVSTSSPSYSPDGRSLAWVQWGKGSRAAPWIYIGRADGRQGRPVIAGIEPEFSPDGGSLVFVREGRCGRGVLRTSIWTLSLQTGRQQRVKTSCGTELGDPTYSPDGDWIAYTVYASYTVYSEGRSDVAFTPVPGHLSTIVPLVAFSADGPISAAPSWQPVSHSLPEYANVD